MFVFLLDLVTQFAEAVASIFFVERLDVVLVNVVDQDGRDCDDFRGSGRSDGHQDHQQNEEWARVAHQRRGHERRHQSFISLLHRQQLFPFGGAQCQVSEAHRGRHAERNGEPAQAARNKPPDALTGLGCDAALPVRLVDENRAEVADQVDDAKHQPPRGENGQVAVVVVTFRAFEARQEVVDRLDCPQFVVVIVSARIAVHLDHETQHDDEDQGGVEIGYVERCT